ncbi:MAG: VCBS repeat-containing protein [Phycisphaerales bacterium]
MIANHNVHYVTILMGDGQGGFQAAEHSPMRVDVDPHPHAIALADMDADGHDDLLIDHSPRGTPAPGLLRSSGGVLVIRGLGDGRFETRGAVLETGGIPYRGFEAVDINADDRPDILTPHGEEVGVLLNTTENDKFSSTRAQPVRATAPFAVRAADFNADGHPDMVVASGEDAAVVQIFFGDGRGGFEAAEGFATRLARGGKNIAIGDLNGDGVADAIVSAYGSDYILLIFGARDELTTAMLPTGFDHPWGLAAGDVNADGVDDLLVVGDGAREGRLYLSVPEQ